MTIEGLITLIITVAMTTVATSTTKTITTTATPTAQEARSSRLQITLPVTAPHAPHMPAVVLASRRVREVATTADIMAMKAIVRTPIRLEVDAVLSGGTILEEIGKRRDKTGRGWEEERSDSDDSMRSVARKGRCRGLG